MAFRSIARKLCTFFAWWLVSLPAIGQMTSNYAATKNTTLNFVYSDCTTPYANANNCWTVVPNAPLLNTVAVGIDGDIWGIETNGTSIVHFDKATRAWPIQTGLSGVTQIALANSSTVYALAAGHVYKFNGSGWTSAFPTGPVSFVAISVGSDGDFWALGQAYGCGRQPYHFNTSSNAWEAKQHGLANISVVDAANVYGSCPSIASPTNNVFKFDGTGWTTLSGWLSQVAVAPQSLDNNSTNVLIWGVGGPGTVYHGNPLSSNGWDSMAGSPSFVAVGGEQYAYGLFSGTLKHYTALRVTVSYTVTGNSNCSSSCTQINHTTTAKLQLTGHSQKTNSLVASAPTPINVPVSDVLTSLESASCIFGEGAATCPQVSSSSSVTCPVMGVIFADNAAGGSFTLWFEPEFAETKLVANGLLSPTNCKTVGNVKSCYQKVASWCTPNTTPPDLNPDHIWTSPPQWTEYWMDYAFCFRPHILSWTGHWACSPGVAIKTVDPTNLFFDCTHTP